MVSISAFQAEDASSILVTCSKTYKFTENIIVVICKLSMRLVLDGIEDRSYKPAHIVRLYEGVPTQD